MEQLTAEQRQSALFMNLVYTFQQAAYQHMGKLPSPVSNKIERDLEQARLSIDMLDMLKTRVKGNVPDNENRLLDHVLRELKLNFVDELDKDQNATKTAAEATTPSTDNLATQVMDTPAQEGKQS